MEKKQKVFIVSVVLVAILLFTVLYHLNLAFHLTGHFEGTERHYYSGYGYALEVEEEVVLNVRQYNPLTGTIEGSFYYSAQHTYPYYHSADYTDKYQSKHFTARLDKKNMTIEVECTSGKKVQLNYNMRGGRWEYSDISLYWAGD
ncbi:MAG: hypothetical protein IJY20_01145 [Clostridia bacterium]|nr:hypothetical protein [Clostridia bacterium]